MSDDWRFFSCTMGESSAFIFVDVGIAKTIGSAPTNLVKTQLRYKNPAPNGLPTNEEFEAMRSIEDVLEKYAAETSGAYVGRVTVAGQRHFFIYSWHAAARWQPFVNELAAQTGYELEVTFRDDPQHEGYWHDLYPTDDDWRVIHDLEVLDRLRKRGDDGNAERQIDHWVYFDNEKAAAQFVTWAEAEDFTHDAKYSRRTDDGTYCVRLHHVGPATIESVSRRTIALRRKAQEHGGKYDGWERPSSQVERGEARELIERKRGVVREGPADGHHLLFDSARNEACRQRRVPHTSRLLRLRAHRASDSEADS